MDEPTTGLDPQIRKFVWETIKKMQKESNMTVILTTHYMEEAAVADQVVVLQNGKIIEKGTPDELKAKYAYIQLKLEFSNEVIGEQWLHEMGISFSKKINIYTIKVERTIQALSILKSAEPFLASFEVIKDTLDDVFIRIIEKGGGNLDLTS